MLDFRKQSKFRKSNSLRDQGSEAVNYRGSSCVVFLVLKHEISQGKWLFPQMAETHGNLSPSPILFILKNPSSVDAKNCIYVHMF